MSLLRKRLLGLLSILPLLVGLVVAAYKFGPSPTEQVAQPVAELQRTPGPTQAEVDQPENNQLFELFGIYQTAVAKGRVQLTPAEYLDSLESVYRQRGYRKLEDFDPNTFKTKRRRSGQKEPLSTKFFQRNDADGIANISATGADADYSSNQLDAEPYTFSTLVIPAERGGAAWATYRIGIDREKIAQLSNLDRGDFPGADPVGVPRLPGLQRIYALSSAGASLAIYRSKGISDTDLILLYLREMPRSGWRLDSTATATADKAAPGVLCFTEGPRTCLVWVTPGKEPGTTNVTISSH